MKKESNRNINIKLLATAVKSGGLGLSEESLRYAVEKAMPEKSKKAALHLLDEFFGA
jgi:Pyruvate/2-oxoacid:ferredoxin oxidoreductase gamma subunit